MRKKILVKGPALTSSGYGEHARLILRALRQHEKHIDIFFENINWGHTGFLIEDNEERKWLDSLSVKTNQYRQAGGNFDISVQVTIPPEWQKVAPVNIGVTAGIESTKIAPQWIEKCRLVDTILVPSQHARYAFDNTTYILKNKQTGHEIDFKNNTPIEVVPYPVKNTISKDISLNLDYEFNFLAVAQWGPRKNLENTIRWFVEEFKSEEVGLVVKASKRKNNLADRMHCNSSLAQLLSSYPDRKCKIYLVHGNMAEEEICGLYTHPQIKAMVSATHGEGFGLPLFEAAYNGLPVIAPNWGGHIDFLYAPKKAKKDKVKNKAHFVKVDYDIAPIQPSAVWEGVLQADSQWCFPKQHSFKSSLREVYKNYGTYKSQARKLSSHLREKFVKEEIYKKIVDIISPSETPEMVDWMNWNEEQQEVRVID
jgi:glycosyltransferase involved in cell wall biosynthesis